MTMISRNMLVSCGVAVCLFAAMAPPPAQAQTLPQVSLLPTVAQVPPGPALPIDGVWRVRENGRRVSIDHGRSIDIDPWVQMFVFRVDPGRVTMRDIHPDGSGGYTGYDLVLLQQVEMHVEPDGSITAIGSGIAPVTYHLDPVSLAAGGVPGVPPAYAPPPSYSPPPDYAPAPGYTPPPGYGAEPGYSPPAGAPPAGTTPGYAPPSAGTPPPGNAEPTVNPWGN